MYGQVLGVTTGGSGAVALAALPATGGLRTAVLVYGIAAVAFGVFTLVATGVIALRNRA